MTTTVVNIRYTLKPRGANTVYIGRGPGDDGYFGNPFKIGPDGDRAGVIEKFRVYFLARLDSDAAYRQRVLALRNKTLTCFCKPYACHGDVIAAWVDEQPG